jgi:hypothetical protein
MEDGKTATIAQTIEGSKEDGEKRFADFSDLKDGGILWRASLVLLHYLEKNALSDLKGKRVIELGSGEPAEKRSHASLFHLGPDLKLLRRDTCDTHAKFITRLHKIFCCTPPCSSCVVDVASFKSLQVFGLTARSPACRIDVCTLRQDLATSARDWRNLGPT